MATAGTEAERTAQRINQSMQRIGTVAVPRMASGADLEALARGADELAQSFARMPEAVGGIEAVKTAIGGIDDEMIRAAGGIDAFGEAMAAGMSEGVEAELAAMRGQLNQTVAAVGAAADQIPEEFDRARDGIAETVAAIGATTAQIPEDLTRALDASAGAAALDASLTDARGDLASTAVAAEQASDRINASMRKIAGGANVRGGWATALDSAGLRDEMAAVGSAVDSTGQTVARTTAGVVGGVGSWGAAFNLTGRNSRFMLQNLGYQISDFAVQVGGGTSALRAFAMQAPQALAGAGMWGAAIGTAIAVAVPLGAALFGVGKQADDSGKRLRELGEELEQLQENFRNATGAARELAGERIRINIEATGQEVFEQQQGTIEDLEAAMLRLRQTGETVAGATLNPFAGLFTDDVSDRINAVSDAFAAGTSDARTFLDSIDVLAREVESAGDSFSVKLAEDLRQAARSAVNARGEFDTLQQMAKDLGGTTFDLEGFRKLRTEIQDLNSQVLAAQQAPPAGTEARARFDDLIDALGEAGESYEKFIELQRQAAEGGPEAARAQADLRRLNVVVDDQAILRAEVAMDDLGEQITDLQNKAAVLDLSERFRAGAAAAAEMGKNLATDEWDRALSPEVAARFQQLADDIGTASNALRDAQFGVKLRELEATAEMAELPVRLRDAAEAANQLGLALYDIPTVDQQANIDQFVALRQAMRETAQGQEVRGLIGEKFAMELPTEELRDLARLAAQAGADFTGLESSPEALASVLEEQVQPGMVELIRLAASLRAEMADIKFGQTLLDQIEKLRSENLFGGRESEASRAEARRVEYRQAKGMEAGAALPEEVERNIVAVSQEETTRLINAERVNLQNRAEIDELRVDYGQRIAESALTTGIEPEEFRIERGRIEARQRLGLTAEQVIPPELDAEIVRAETAATALAESQRAFKELAQQNALRGDPGADVMGSTFGGAFGGAQWVEQQKAQITEQTRQLDALVANRGRETEEMRVQATLGELALTHTRDQVDALEGAVRAQEMARTEAEAATTTAGLEDQLAQAELMTEYVGREGESYRVQQQLLAIKLRQMGEITDEQRRLVGEIEAETQERMRAQAALETRRETGGVERQIAERTSAGNVFSELLTGQPTEQFRLAEREQGLRERGMSEEDIESLRAGNAELERTNTTLGLVETASDAASSATADLARTLIFEGTDEAGQRLLEMLVDMQLQLAADLVVALALKAVMASMGMGGAPIGAGATPAGGGAPRQLFPAAAPTTGGLYALGGPVRAGQTVSAGEAGIELYASADLPLPRGSRGEIIRQAAELGIPMTEATKISATQAGLAVLGMSIEAAEGGGAPTASRGMQIVGRSGATVFRPPSDGQIISSSELRAIESIPSGRAMLQTIGRARGGDVRGGKSYLVGEDGQPEAFVPDLTGATMNRSAGDLVQQLPPALARVLENAPDLVPAATSAVPRPSPRPPRPGPQPPPPPSPPGPLPPAALAALALVPGALHGSALAAPSADGAAAGAAAALQRGGPARAGEPVLTGEQGAEMVIPGRIGRMVRAGQFDEVMPLLEGLSSRDLPRMVGMSGPERIRPEIDSEVIAHHDLARLRNMPVGEELVRIALAAPRQLPDTTRMLATGTIGVPASSAREPQRGDTRINFQVIDQRPHGAPPIETRRQTGADGVTTITAIVRAGLNDMQKSGELGEMLRQGYGVSPVGR